MTSRAPRRSAIAGCVGIAASVVLAGCSLSGNTSSTTKSTLPRVTGGGTSSPSTFKTVPISPTAPPTTSVISTPPTDKSGNAIPPDGYIVKPGDTLSGIATGLGINYPDLLAANPGLDPKAFLIAGQKIQLPVGLGSTSSATTGGGQTSTQTSAPTTNTTSGVQASGLTYTVVSGDYFIGIAKKLGVSLNDLLAVNNMNSGSLITAGMKLKVPKGGSLPKATATTVKATTTTKKP